MADLATLADVENNWRSLRPPAEQILASSLLTTASGSLRIRVPGLDARIAESDDLADLVRGIVAMAVVRVLRGRDPNDPATSTEIFFTKAELNALDLGGDTTAFTLTPVGADPGYRTALDWPWDTI